MSHSLSTMIAAHPHIANVRELLSMVPALNQLTLCEQICRLCADACLAETKPEGLRKCILLNLDCAEVCSTTARLLLRPEASDADARETQLHACIELCQACGDACAEHADHHGHCRICAEACRLCQEICNRLSGETSAAGTFETS